MLYLRRAPLLALTLFGCASTVEHPDGSAPDAGASAAAHHGDAGLHAAASGSAMGEHAAPMGSAMDEKAHEHVTGMPHWTYGGATGPMFWGELDPKWAPCKTGTAQSPIDIPTKTEEGKGVEPLAIDYLPIPLHVRNNGHALEVVNVGNNYVTVGKKRYDLLQFHLHSPSEHTIAGQRFDLEMHLVHQSADKELAVVAILFKEGEASEALKELWRKAPRDVSTEPTIVEKKSVDLSGMTSLREGYYHYLGSLTTPPCGEGVRWYVLKQTQTDAKKSIEQMREVLQGRNNRPVQPLGDRKVFLLKP